MILSLACDTILILSQEALFCYPHHFRLLYSPQHSWGIRLFIYAQIVDRLKHEIVSGFYPPGSRLPSVRDLAAQASVNPNTMQKAFTELERTGLIVTRRTSGRTVTEDTALIEQVRSELAELQISQFLTRMQHLGYQKDDSIRLLLAKKEENS